MLWVLEKSQWLNWKKTDFQVKGALNFFLLGNGVQGRVKFRETIICKEGSNLNYGRGSTDRNEQNWKTSKQN